MKLEVSKHINIFSWIVGQAGRERGHLEIIAIDMYRSA